MRILFNNGIFLILIHMIFLSGCGTIKSTKITSSPGNTKYTGVTYYLPAQRTKAQLYRNKSSEEKNKYPLFILQISPGPAYPDAKNAYYLEYNPSVFNDEHLCVARTSEGLLSTVQFSTANRTGDILVRMAETAAMVALALGGVPASPPETGIHALGDAEKRKQQILQNLIRLTEVKPDSGQFDLVYTGLFDRLKNGEKATVENHINTILLNELSQNLAFQDLKFKENDVNISFSPASNGQAGGNGIQTSSAAQTSESTTEQLLGKGNGTQPPAICDRENNSSNGGVIHYRTLTTELMTISLNSNPLGNIIVPAINPSGDQCISVERALFVRKVSRFDFTNGLLTGVSINTPSVALAVAELPLRIGSAVIEMPASFFTAIGRSFTSQTAMVGREIELINALEKLKQTQAKPDTASNITVQTPSGEPPKIGVTLSAPADPYKPLGGLTDVTLTCWDGAKDNAAK